MTARVAVLHTAAVIRRAWKFGPTAICTAAIAAALQMSPASVRAACSIGKVAELPITMSGLKPMVSAQINGGDAQFLLDSGASYSMMSAASAAQFNLPLSPAPFGLRMQGIGGSAAVEIATVKEFTLAGKSLHKVEFLAGGSEVAAIGLLGQNLLQRFDVEYDFANGIVRLFLTKDCGKAQLAYWDTGKFAYSQLAIEKIEYPWQARTVGAAYVNGQKIRVKFDTGAGTSMLTLKAAQRAGIKTDSPGVVAAGYVRGIGRSQVQQYIAPIASFKLGDNEEIKSTKLEFADIELGDADMLLGADFFLAHHVFVGNAERKLFFTFNGGTVFNLSQGARHSVASGAAADADKAAAAAEGAAAEGAAADPAAAADFARRGAALTARREFEPALAALSKAVELAPADPEFRFQRGNVYALSRRYDAALADYAKAIELSPEFLPAYVPHAELLLQNKRLPEALADLAAVDRLAPKQADLRFQLAQIYRRIERFPAAIEQYDLWIASHQVDSRIGAALADRCFVSAVENTGLDQGLKDCNGALRIADKRAPGLSTLYADRGMLWLRQAAYDKALADFDAALQAAPRNSRALYGRGVAEARKNKLRESAADIAAAETLTPNILSYYQRYGISP